MVAPIASLESLRSNTKCHFKVFFLFSKISPHELYEVSQEEQMKQKAEAAFKAFDQNKDGVVTKKEMAITSGGRLSKVKRFYQC